MWCCIVRWSIRSIRSLGPETAKCLRAVTRCIPRSTQQRPGEVEHEYSRKSEHLSRIKKPYPSSVFRTSYKHTYNRTSRPRPWRQSVVLFLPFVNLMIRAVAPVLPVCSVVASDRSKRTLDQRYLDDAAHPMFVGCNHLSHGPALVSHFQSALSSSCPIALPVRMQHCRLVVVLL